MKSFSTIILAVAVVTLFGFSSCSFSSDSDGDDNGTTTTTVGDDDNGSDTPAAPDYNSEYTADLIGSGDHMRGIGIGDSYDKVEGTMAGNTIDDIDEEGKSYIMYEVHTEPSLYLDFYFDADGKVEGIDASGYMDTNDDAKQLYLDFRDHAKSHFGEPDTQESGYAEWMKDDYSVSVELSGTEAYYYYDTFGKE